MVGRSSTQIFGSIANFCVSHRSSCANDRGLRTTYAIGAGTAVRRPEDGSGRRGGLVNLGQGNYGVAPEGPRGVPERRQALQRGGISVGSQSLCLRVGHVVGREFLRPRL